MLLYSESCSGVFGSTVWGGGRGWAQLVESYLLQVNHVQSVHVPVRCPFPSSRRASSIGGYSGMWVPGGMTAFVGGGLLSGSFWLCKSLMDAMLCGLGDKSGGNGGAAVGQGQGCSPTRVTFLELQGWVLRILLWLLFEAAAPVPWRGRWSSWGTESRHNMLDCAAMLHVTPSLLWVPRPGKGL